MRQLLVAAMMLLMPWAAQAACTISSATLAFGTFTGAALNGTGSFTVNCTNGTAYTVAADGGLNWGGSFPNMRGGASSQNLGYILYRDGARTQTWGGGVNAFTGTGTGTTQTVNFYARVNAWAYNAPGTYTDTVRMTVAGSSTAIGSMAVSATEPVACAISANPLNFGIYIGVALSATATLAVTCTSTTPYYVNLDNGMQSKCCWSNQMIGPGGKLLNYQLFQDAARTNPWWNTVNVDGQAGTGTGANQSLTVYGLTFGGQMVTPGAYADTVVVKITY
jgi:spore coat protein U-like protein